MRKKEEEMDKKIQDFENNPMMQGGFGRTSVKKPGAGFNPPSTTNAQ